MSQVDLITAASDDDLIWGAAAIGAVINKSKRATYWMLENGFLPAKKVGGQYCSTRKKLRDYCAGDAQINSEKAA